MVVLQAIAVRPQQCVGDIALLSGEEQQQLLEWSVNQGPSVVSAPVHRLIEQQVACSPNAVALICGNAQITLADLNARANRLARRLVKLGVGPDVRVAIAVERSADMVIGLLAVLKAGGAYVPLDLSYPA